MESVTHHPLTKYERIQVVGSRAEQLARGAQSFVLPIADRIESPYELAERELETLRLPMIVMRTLPDGRPQYVRLSTGDDIPASAVSTLKIKTTE